MGRPDAAGAVYGLTAALLFVSPAVSVVGATWVVLDALGTPAALVAAGLSGTGYAVFMAVVLARSGVLDADA